MSINSRASSPSAGQRETVATPRRIDTELAQSITRVIISLSISLFCHYRALVRHEASFSGIAFVVTIYFCYSLVHLAWVAGKPGTYKVRRVIGIIGDQGTSTIAFVIGGRSAFAFFVVYIWVCVGNGMRFGSRYMYFATALGALGFGFAIWQRDLAANYFDLVVGIYICIIAIPLFVRKLFAQLERANRQLQDQARQLQHDATHDRLTGLANRAIFFDRLDELIAHSDLHHSSFALIYFDIDHFKSINDKCGHSVGDEFLRQVSSEISASIRKGDDFCRLSGDEFVVLLEDVAKEEVASRVATSIQGIVKKRRTIDGQPVEVSASIGIALYPAGIPGEDPQSVANRADLAMYYSKRNGRGRQTLYHPGLSLPQDAFA